MDVAERQELDLGLPEGVRWWEVRAEYPDGDAPWPPPCYPPGVEAIHSARVTVVRLRAPRGSVALAWVEDVLGVADGQWAVRPVTAAETITGR